MGFTEKYLALRGGNVGKTTTQSAQTTTTQPKQTTQATAQSTTKQSAPAQQKSTQATQAGNDFTAKYLAAKSAGQATAPAASVPTFTPALPTTPAAPAQQQTVAQRIGNAAETVGKGASDFLSSVISGGDVAWGGLFGALSAVDEATANAANSVKKFITGDKSESEPFVSPFREYAQYHNEKAAETLGEATEGRGKVGQKVMSTGQAIGNMLAMSSLGALGQGTGAGIGATFGTSEAALGAGAAQKGLTAVSNAAARLGNEILTHGTNAAISLGSGGQTYLKAVNSGAEQGKALQNAILAGLIEYESNKMFSGTPLEDTGEKGYVTKLIEYTADKLGKSEALASFLNSAVGKGASIAFDKIGEGLEEVIAEIGDPIAERITWNPQADLATIDEIVDAFEGGILLSTMMSGGEAVIDNAAKIAQRAQGNATPAPVNAGARQTSAEGNLTPAANGANLTAKNAPQGAQTQTAQIARRDAATQATLDAALAATPEAQAAAQQARANALNAEREANRQKLVELFANTPVGEAVQQNAAAEAAARAEAQRQAEEVRRRNAESDPAQHIDNRDMADMSDKGVNAFSFDHPELHDYFVDAARSLIADADASLSQPNSRQRVRGMEGKKYNQSAQTSQQLRMAMDETGLTRNQIIDAAQRIIDNHGQENAAAAKKVELILDNMLTNGYTTMYGETFDPNEAYLAAKRGINGARIGAENGTFEKYVEDNRFLLDIGEVTMDELRAEWEQMQAEERATDAERENIIERQSAEQMEQPPQNTEPQTHTVGGAEHGFETPESRGTPQQSRLSDTSMGWNERRGEAAGGMSREDWDARFRYQSQTEAQSMAQADDLVFLEQDGARKFLYDVDPALYDSFVEYLRGQLAWSAAMTDAAHIAESEMQRLRADGDVDEQTYIDLLDMIREHTTETGRGVQANAKWSRTGNERGTQSRMDAWTALENNDSLTQTERLERLDRIVKWDSEIEQAQNDDDLKRIILEVADERGTINNALTRKQSALLRGVAKTALDGLTSAELKQFAYQSTAALATDGTHADAGQVIKTIQILNMLSNPKTAAKNLTGNTTFYGLDVMSMRGAALLDMALSKITGTRSTAFEQSVLSKEVREALIHAIRLSAAEVSLDVDMGGESRYGTSSNRTNKAGSNNPFERALSAIERNQGYLLTTTDEAFKGAARATENATQRLIDAGKIKNAGANYAKNQADALARYRTFQNDGKIAGAIQTIHDLFNMVGIGDSGKQIKGHTVHSFGVGDLIAPFTRVAGNLASVGVDYSPANAVKGTVEILDTIRRAAAGQEANPARQAKAVSDFARGMTGTAVAYGIIQLVRNGLIRRADDEEDEDVAKLNAAEGMRGTQVNIDAAQRFADGKGTDWKRGDTLIDLSNLEPINFIISFAADMADNDADGFLQTFIDPETYVDVGASAARTAGELPILQGVGEFAKDVLVYHNDPIEAAAEMLGKTAVSSVTPNIIASLAKGMDEKQRNIYADEGLAATLVNYAKSRIPNVTDQLDLDRETLPTTTDVTGAEKLNPGTETERIINAMINPLGVNEYTQSDVSSEMQRVRSKAGDASFYPTTRQPKTLEYTDKDGKKHEAQLTYEQQQAFQKTVSSAQFAITTQMIATPAYRNADASDQAAMLKRCYDYAYQVGKAGVLGEGAADSWVKHAQTAWQDLGMTPVEFLQAYDKYGAGDGILGGNSYDKTMRMIDSGVSIDEWARMKDKVNTDPSNGVTKAELTAYIEANFPPEKWGAIFDAYKGGLNWKNPY